MVSEQNRPDSLIRSDPERMRQRSALFGMWLLPVLLLGFVALAAVLFRDRLRPAIPVRIGVVVLLPMPEGKHAEGDASRPAGSHSALGAMLFQTSGWIEPDPALIRVSAKTDGFVQAVHVLEGESVRAGQLLATLDPADARLNLARSEKGLQEAEQALVAHRASVLAAEATVRRVQAERAAAKARAEEAEDRYTRFVRSEEGDTSTLMWISVDEINQAQRERDVTRAELEAAEAMIDEARAGFDGAREGTAALDAAVGSARAARDQAALALERTRIVAPMSGVVQRRFAAPGMKRIAAMGDLDSSTIVQLYDPERLQVRVDVPLAEVGRVAIGQLVRVFVAMFPDRVFTARVTRITGEADIQRNTLEVKAAIEEPDARLRPEMLCRLEFVESGDAATGGPGSAASAGRAEVLRRWAPDAALGAVKDDRAMVWVADPLTSRATPRDVHLGSARREGFRLVLEGLREGERVILDAPPTLKPEVRVRPLSEESE